MNSLFSSISPVRNRFGESFGLINLLACALALVFLVPLFVQAQEPEPVKLSPDPVSQRLVNLTGTPVISPDDIRFLESFTAQQEAGTSIAFALLYKFLPERYTQAFQSYFQIDFTAPKKIISDDKLAQRVEAITAEFSGRPQVELISRLYNEFRGSNLYKKESADSLVSLEFYYRTALFQNTMQGALQNALRLAAQADRTQE